MIIWTSPKLKPLDSKDTIKEMKDSTKNDRKYFQTIYLIRDLYLKSYNSIIKRHIAQFYKWLKIWTISLRKLYKWQWAPEMWAMSQVFREIEIKTPMRYYFILTKVTRIKKTNNNRYWRRCGEIPSRVAGGNI